MDLDSPLDHLDSVIGMVAFALAFACISSYVMLPYATPAEKRRPSIIGFALGTSCFAYYRGPGAAPLTAADFPTSAGTDAFNIHVFEQQMASWWTQESTVPLRDRLFRYFAPWWIYSNIMLGMTRALGMMGGTYLMPCVISFMGSPVDSMMGTARKLQLLGFLLAIAVPMINSWCGEILSLGATSPISCGLQLTVLKKMHRLGLAGMAQTSSAEAQQVAQESFYLGVSFWSSPMKSLVVDALIGLYAFSRLYMLFGLRFIFLSASTTLLLWNIGAACEAAKRAHDQGVYGAVLGRQGALNLFLENFRQLRLYDWMGRGTAPLREGRATMKRELLRSNMWGSMGSVFTAQMDNFVVLISYFLTVFVQGERINFQKSLSASAYMGTVMACVFSIMGCKMSWWDIHMKAEHIERFLRLPERQEQAIETGPLQVMDATFAWPRLGTPGNLPSEGQSTAADDLQPVLCDICFQPRQGELVLICGAVGAAKSSLLMALLGELPCAKGTLRRPAEQVAYQSQVPYIIEGTIRDNVLFGTPLDDRSEVHLQQALAAAQLTVDMDDSRNTLHALRELTKVGKRGGHLSGGQKARLALARAIFAALRGATLALLDDPVASVDNEVVQAAWDEGILGAMRGITRVVVVNTQLLERLAPTADRLLVLADGRIAYNGPPEGATEALSSACGGDYQLHPASASSLERRGTEPRNASTAGGGEQEVSPQAGGPQGQHAEPASHDFTGSWLTNQGDEVTVVQRGQSVTIECPVAPWSPASATATGATLVVDAPSMLKGFAGMFADEKLSWINGDVWHRRAQAETGGEQQGADCDWPSFDGVYQTDTGSMATVVQHGRTVTVSIPGQDWSPATGHASGAELTLSSPEQMRGFSGTLCNDELRWSKGVAWLRRPGAEDPALSLADFARDCCRLRAFLESGAASNTALSKKPTTLTRGDWESLRVRLHRLGKQFGPAEPTGRQRQSTLGIIWSSFVRMRGLMFLAGLMRFVAGFRSVIIFRTVQQWERGDSAWGDRWHFLLLAVQSIGFVVFAVVAGATEALGKVLLSDSLAADIDATLVALELPFFWRKPEDAESEVRKVLNSDLMSFSSICQLPVHIVQCLIGVVATAVHVPSLWLVLVLALFGNRLIAGLTDWKTSQAFPAHYDVINNVWIKMVEQYDGLVSLRALKREAHFERMLHGGMMNKPYYNCMIYPLDVFISLVQHCIGAVFTVVSIVIIVRRKAAGAASSEAFLLYNLSVTLSGMVGALCSLYMPFKDCLQKYRFMENFLCTELLEPTGGASPPASWPAAGRVEFECVTFRYVPYAPPALRNVSFVVRPAEKLGVVGKTGSGKSTLMSLLLRLGPLSGVAPSSGGRVLLDGLDVATLRLSDLRSKVAVVPQEPTIFSMSLRDNIGTFTKAETLAALEWCGLDARQVTQRPTLEEALEAPIATGALSVGQQQLLMAARALARRPKVMILDECTACLDRESADRLLEAVTRHAESASVLSIAHRLRFVLRSDRILVLKHGEVIALDTPAKLLEDASSYFSVNLRLEQQEQE